MSHRIINSPVQITCLCKIRARTARIAPAVFRTNKNICVAIGEQRRLAINVRENGNARRVFLARELPRIAGASRRLYHFSSGLPFRPIIPGSNYPVVTFSFFPFCFRREAAVPSRHKCVITSVRYNLRQDRRIFTIPASAPVYFNLTWYYLFTSEKQFSLLPSRFSVAKLFKFVDISRLKSAPSWILNFAPCDH